LTALGPRIAVEILGSDSRSRGRAVFAELADEIMSNGPRPRPLTISRPALENAAAPATLIPALAGIEPESWVAGLVLFCCIWEEAVAAAEIPSPRGIFRPFALADFDGLKDVLERRSDADWSTDGIRVLQLPGDVENVVIAWAEHRINLLSEVRVIDADQAGMNDARDAHPYEDEPEGPRRPPTCPPRRSGGRCAPTLGGARRQRREVATLPTGPCPVPGS